jgi:hypothetical protein
MSDYKEYAAILLIAEKNRSLLYKENESSILIYREIKMENMDLFNGLIKFMNHNLMKNTD